MARRMWRGLRRAHGRLLLRLGTAARTRPLCADFGFSRGTPIDRYYIERFLADHAPDIRGHVLEIGEDTYSKRFGGDRIGKQDILHLSSNAQATIVGDLTRGGTLPAATFDCIILTQTLHYIFDMAAAVRQVHQALKPGGVALITVPGITAIDPSEKDSWYWSLTGPALRRLLCGPFDPANVAVTPYGNFHTASAFLLGAALEEVKTSNLDVVDESYPVTVAARAIA